MVKPDVVKKLGFNHKIQKTAASLINGGDGSTIKPIGQVVLPVMLRKEKPKKNRRKGKRRRRKGERL